MSLTAASMLAIFMHLTSALPIAPTRSNIDDQRERCKAMNIPESEMITTTRPTMFMHGFNGEGTDGQGILCHIAGWDQNATRVTLLNAMEGEHSILIPLARQVRAFSSPLL